MNVILVLGFFFIHNDDEFNQSFYFQYLKVLHEGARHVEPPLRRQWKEKECARPISFPARSAHRARLGHVSGLIPLEHVPLRTQDSSVTRPGDMGTSSAKVNGLLRSSTTPSTGHAWVCTRAYTCMYERACVRAYRTYPIAGGVRASRRSHEYAPDIDTIHVIAGESGAEGMPTSARVMLPCYVARQLDILRSARIPCRVDDDGGGAIATPRNARAHTPYETLRGEMSLGSCPFPEGAACRVSLSDRTSSRLPRVESVADSKKRGERRTQIFTEI